MLESTRLAQTCKEIENYKLDILGLAEVRWPNAEEKIINDGYNDVNDDNKRR